MTIVKNIRDTFTNPAIDLIVEQSNYESIHNMHLSLNVNAASINSHLGNRLLSLLALAVTQALDNTISAVLLVNLVNPEHISIYPLLSTVAQILALK